MKNVVKTFIVSFLIIVLATASKAQNVQKIGYVDFNSLVAAMPGVDSVKIKLQKYQQTLSDQLDAMRAEFENKYLEFQQGSEEVVRFNKTNKTKRIIRSCKKGLMLFNRKPRPICSQNSRNSYNLLFQKQRMQ